MSIDPRDLELYPFSLACFDCEAGEDVTSADQAERLGWIDLECRPDGLGWNFLGQCPDCRAEELAEEAARQARYS